MLPLQSFAVRYLGLLGLSELPLRPTDPLVRSVYSRAPSVGAAAAGTVVATGPAFAGSPGAVRGLPQRPSPPTPSPTPGRPGPASLPARGGTPGDRHQGRRSVCPTFRGDTCERARSWSELALLKSRHGAFREGRGTVGSALQHLV